MALCPRWSGFRRYGAEDADVELEETFVYGEVEGDVGGVGGFDGGWGGDVDWEEEGRRGYS